VFCSWRLWRNYQSMVGLFGEVECACILVVVTVSYNIAWNFLTKLCISIPTDPITACNFKWGPGLPKIGSLHTYTICAWGRPDKLQRSALSPYNVTSKSTTPFKHWQCRHILKSPDGSCFLSRPLQRDIGAGGQLACRLWSPFITSKQ